MRSLTRYLISAMLLIALAAGVYVLMSAAGGPGHISRLEKLAGGELSKMDFATAGQSAPDTIFLDPDGEEMTLAAFEGRYILVNLWATWCAPCEEEMPSLAALQRARGGDQFMAVAISVDGESDRDFAAGELAKLTGGWLEFYHAPDYKITYGMGARGFPTSVIYDPDGTEIARLSGDADWSSFEAVAFIDAVLAE